MLYCYKKKNRGKGKIGEEEERGKSRRKRSEEEGKEAVTISQKQLSILLSIGDDLSQNWFKQNIYKYFPHSFVKTNAKLQKKREKKKPKCVEKEESQAPSQHC